MSSCYQCRRTGARSCEPHCGLCNDLNEKTDGLPNGMVESDYTLED